MRTKVLSIVVAMMMVITGVSSVLAYDTAFVTAETEDPYEAETLDGKVDTTKNNYMTDSQYKKLFGVDLNSKDIEAFDPNVTDNPLEGYTPSILSELFMGYMNRTDNYDGQFAIMENASNDAGFNMNTMWNTNYGGVTTYYGENQDRDMYTHAIGTIALTPGNLTDENANLRQQILIENRIYLNEDGLFYEDDTRQMVSTYTLKNGSWVRKKCNDIYLSDAHWAWYIEPQEQQSYTSMAVGDYDGDNYNEVAVYVPAKSTEKTDKWPRIDIYQPKEESDGYSLTKEYSFSLKDIGARFGVQEDGVFAVAHLNTTKIAGRDDLVLAISLPYIDKGGYTNNGALAVVSYRNGNKNIEFNTDLKYDNNAYRFKMQATANADLNGDGTDELVVGGFKESGYKIDLAAKGGISDKENLVNVLLYDDGAYEMAWSKPQETGALDGLGFTTMEAPAAMAAGKYRVGAIKDTVFLEGTYLDFAVGSGETVNEQIKNGRFTQDTTENASNLDGSFINLGASGTFVSDKPGNEEVVFYTTTWDKKVDIDIVWGHPKNGGKIATDVIINDYIDNTEYDDGTIVTMCPVNVDQDSSIIKYTGKVVGWSNPVVYGILMSMPYWQELDYGTLWNARGQTDFGISKSKEDGTSVTTGVDFGRTINISGEASVLGNGVAGSFDVGPVGSFAYEHTKSKTLSKDITWSVGGGQDSAALLVMPVVTYKYDVIMPEHEATKEEQAAGKSGKIPELVSPVACTITEDPVVTDLPIETYNDVIEEFNAMAEASGNSQDKLPLINMDEIYAGAKMGDPSSYASSPKNISSLTGEEGKEYYYVGDVHAQTGKDKSVETLSIEAVSSDSESNGFTAGLKTSLMGKVTAGLDFMSIVSVGGSIGTTVDLQVAGGKAWISTESTGITYSGAFANLPKEAEDYGYEYSAGLVKWNADIKGLDQDLKIEGTDEILPDKTVVIGPVVSMLGEVAPPAVPTDLHVLGITDKKVVLQWTNPEGERLPDYYKVYYSNDDENYYVLSDEVDSDKTTHEITGLSPGKTYYFRLQGYYKANPTRSVLSPPVAATTKDGSEAIIKEQPEDCYTAVGEKAIFDIKAEAKKSGSELSYQWQKLIEEDYGISWRNIDAVYDDTIGKTAEFNAAYESPDGLIRTQDVDDLDGNVYRCIVMERNADTIDYIEVASDSATLHVGDKVTASGRNLKITASSKVHTAEDELLAAAGDDIKVAAEFKDKQGKALANETVNFALMDNGQDGKCIAYVSGETDAEGKVSISFDDVAAGAYEIIAIVKKTDAHKATVSNSIQLIVNSVHEIKYELNGGVNHNLNPKYYGEGSKHIFLRNASREGYEFTGWYLDPELKNKVEVGWIDISELNNPITLYAGWKAIESDTGSGGDNDNGGNTDGEGVDKQPVEKEEPTNSADTGDNTNLLIPVILAAAALCGIAAVLFGRRKKK